MIKEVLGVFIPTKENNFHPLALRRSSLFIYAVFLVLINTFSGIIDKSAFTKVSAAEISTSQLIEYVNKERRLSKLVELRESSKLSNAAEEKAQDMFKKNYWSHFGPNGETPWQFIISSGYDYTFAGENLAKDFATTEAIHAAWMASPTHRANIVKSEYRDIGIASASGYLDGVRTTIVVQMFGSVKGVEINAVGSLPQTVATSGASSTPFVNFPVEDGVYSTHNISIKGSSGNSKELTVFLNQKEIGKLPVEGGIFDYKVKNALQDGMYQTYVLGATVSGNNNQISNKVNFGIDTKPPVLDNEMLSGTYEKTNEEYILDLYLKPAEKLQSATLVFPGKQVELSQVDDSTLYVRTTIEATKIDAMVNSSELLNVVAKDTAGNESNFQFKFNDVFTQKNTTSSFFSGIGQMLLGGIISFDSMSLSHKINIFFAVAILLVLLLDAFWLWKLGLVREGGKFLMPAFIFVLVVLVGVFVGSNSTIM